MSATRISFFPIKSVPFLLQSEIKHLSHHCPEVKTTVVLPYVWLVCKMKSLVFLFLKT